jgi:hypothetical protein
MEKIITLAILCLVWWSSASLAESAISQTNDSEKSIYIKTFHNLQKLPSQAIEIHPCSADETRWFLQLMVHNHVENDLFYPSMVKVHDDGTFVDGYNDLYTLYKGDFNNTGGQQYLLLATSLDMMTNSVIGVWQVLGSTMTKLNFDSSVVQGVIGNGDISSFYLHVAKPFAYISNGKTYLRFMQAPYGIDPERPNRYDVSQLAVCTYVWQDQKFSLIGPQKCMGGKEWKP